MGAKRGGEGRGGGARGRHRNNFCSPITFIVHNQKSNGGQWGAPWFEMGGGGGGGGGMTPHSYATARCTRTTLQTLRLRTVLQIAVQKDQIGLPHFWFRL